MPQSSANPAKSLLTGAPNFRDLGGIRTVDGRRVKSGMIFRSGKLSDLTSGDLEALRRLGIRLVCDLRNEPERLAHPSRWPEGDYPEFLRLEIGITDVEQDLWRTLKSDLSIRGVQRVISDGALMTAKHMARPITVLFHRLAEGGFPAVIHCSAGRDRTGFVSACLLHLLQARSDEITADYMLTGDSANPETLAATLKPVIEMLVGGPVPRPVLDALNTVTPERLEGTFVVLRSQFGSFENYLTYCGIESATVSRLQELLLE